MKKNVKKRVIQLHGPGRASFAGLFPPLVCNIRGWLYGYTKLKFRPDRWRAVAVSSRLAGGVFSTAAMSVPGSSHE
jgi:hypothetical protein